MSTRAVIRRAGQAEAVSLAGLPLVFLVTGERTKHTSMFHWTVAPGFSTGLHVHEIQEETFYVLEGECAWQIGEEHVKAGPGTYAFIPPGVPHNIGNAGGSPASMLMTVSPPGHEHYFEELAKLVGAARHPDPNHIAELRSRYDTRQLSALKK